MKHCHVDFGCLLRKPQIEFLEYLPEAVRSKAKQREVNLLRNGEQDFGAFLRFEILKEAKSKNAVTECKE